MQRPGHGELKHKRVHERVGPSSTQLNNRGSANFH